MDSEVCVFCKEGNRKNDPLIKNPGLYFLLHDNCAAYSSGLVTLDLKNVLAEIKRGKKKTCPHCKKRGATVGCEVPECRRSYHYPCVKKAKGVYVERQNTFGVYCFQHKDRKDNPTAQTDPPHDGNPGIGLPPGAARRSSNRKKTPLYSPQVIERKRGKLDTETVKKEIKRGKRLSCSYCKKKGATVGCDVGRCKKTFHYPCVKQARGVFVRKRKIVYCYQHKYRKSMCTQQKSAHNGVSEKSKSRVSEKSKSPGPSHPLSKSNGNKTAKKRKRIRKDLKSVRKKIRFDEGSPSGTQQNTERRGNLASNHTPSHQLQVVEDGERPGPSGMSNNYHQVYLRIISATDTESSDSNSSIVQRESAQDSDIGDSDSGQRNDNDGNMEVPPKKDSNDSCILINSDDEDFPMFNGSQLVYIKNEVSQRTPDESVTGTPSGQSANLVHSTPHESTQSSSCEPLIHRSLSISGYPKRNKKRKTKRDNPELQAALPTMSPDERNAYSQVYDEVGGSLSMSQEMPEDNDCNVSDSNDGQSEDTDVEGFPPDLQPNVEDTSNESTATNAGSASRPANSDAESGSPSLLHRDANTSQPPADCTTVTTSPTEQPDNPINQETSSDTGKCIDTLQPANGRKLVSTNGEITAATQYQGLRSGISSVAAGLVAISDSKTVDMNPRNIQAVTLYEHPSAPSNPNVSLTEEPMNSNCMMSSLETEQQKNSFNVNKSQSSSIPQSASIDRPPNEPPMNFLSMSSSSDEHPVELLRINQTSNEQSATSSLKSRLSEEQCYPGTNKTSDEKTTQSSLTGGAPVRRCLTFPEEQAPGASSKQGTSEVHSVDSITGVRIGHSLDKEVFAPKTVGSSKADVSALAKKLEDSSTASEKAPMTSYTSPDVSDVVASQPGKRAERLPYLTPQLKELSDQLRQGAFSTKFSSMIPQIQSTVQSAKKIKWSQSQSSADVVIGAGTGGLTDGTNNVHVEVSDAVRGAASDVCSEGRDGIDVQEVEVYDTGIRVDGCDSNGDTDDVDVDEGVTGNDIGGGADDSSGDTDRDVNGNDIGGGADDSSGDTDREVNDAVIGSGAGDASGGKEVDGEVFDAGIGGDGCDARGDTDGMDVDERGTGTGIGGGADDDSIGDTDREENGTGTAVDAADSGGDTDGMDGDSSDAGIGGDGCDSSGEADDVDVGEEVIGTDIGVDAYDSSGDTEGVYGEVNGVCAGDSSGGTDEVDGEVNDTGIGGDGCDSSGDTDGVDGEVSGPGTGVVADDSSGHTDGVDGEIDDASIGVGAGDSSGDTDAVDGEVNDATNVPPTPRSSQTEQSKGFPARCDRPVHLNREQKNQLCESYQNTEKQMSRTGAAQAFWNWCMENKCQEYLLTRIICCIKTVVHNIVHEEPDERDYDQAFVFLQATGCFTDFVNDIQGEGSQTMTSSNMGSKKPCNESQRPLLHDLSTLSNELKAHEDITTRDEDDHSGIETDLPETSSALVNTSKDESLRKEHHGGIETELPETSMSLARDRKIESSRHKIDDKIETETPETSSSIARGEEENMEVAGPDGMEAETLQTSSTLMTSKKDDSTREEDCDRAQLKSSETPSVGNEIAESTRKGEYNRKEPKSYVTTLLSPIREEETALLQRSPPSSSASSKSDVTPPEIINTNGMTSEQFQTLVIRMLEHIEKQNKSHWEQEQDGDVSFVKSLAPLLKKVPEDKKILTQIALLHVLSKNI
ncbi:PHD finger protein 11 isoform X4 [Hyperolius riggenbachi]|uniref:PHD finger protein 11 isoform X4 n=1 Tax=Hyperolius riggenbachi TaxID=752182 RepID=UPI0035A3795E